LAGGTFPFRAGFGISAGWEGGRTTPCWQALSAFRRPSIPEPIREAIQAGAETGGQGLSDIVFDPNNIEEMEQRLEDLRARHRELDETIARLKAEGGDDISIMALKREKLRVKDRIVWLSSKIMPDIIA
jgi:hypothetical protein